jgi:hypothetical protein
MARKKIHALDHKREYRRFDWHRNYRRECEQEYEPVCEHGDTILL